MSGKLIVEKSINELPKSHALSNNKIDFVKSNRAHFNNIFRNIVSQDEASDLAKSTISQDAELIDYYLRSYSDEKLGFLSAHLSFILVVKVPGCSGVIRRNFFVKTVPIHIPNQMDYVKEKNSFEKETGFFKHIMPLLMENYKGDAWTPKCYLVKEHTLIFEDMKYKGFSNRPRLFDVDTLKSAVKCIARFHCCSLLAEERLNGKPLNELYPQIFEEAEYTRKGRKYAWFTTAINLAISVAENLGLNTSNIRRASEVVFEIALPSKTKRNVIGHGDLWSSNLIFDEIGNCNLVDFQLIRYTPLAHDIAQLLYLTTTREIREKHERSIIELYYKTLNDCLSISGFNGVIPPFDEILQGMEEQRFSALVSAVINYPTIMMDGKIGAEVMNELDAYEGYFFCDRKPFVDKIMALDPTYETKIQDIVREFVQLSLNFDSLPRPT